MYAKRRKNCHRENKTVTFFLSLWGNSCVQICGIQTPWAAFSELPESRNRSPLRGGFKCDAEFSQSTQSSAENASCRLPPVLHWSGKCCPRVTAIVCCCVEPVPQTFLRLLWLPESPAVVIEVCGAQEHGGVWHVSKGAAWARVSSDKWFIFCELSIRSIWSNTICIYLHAVCTPQMFAQITLVLPVKERNECLASRVLKIRWTPSYLLQVCVVWASS